MDQAATLREIFEGNRMEVPSPLQSTAEVYLVTSGKGGVGKSMFATNLAITAGTLSKPSLLIDANTQGAHLDLMLNTNPRHRLNEVISGDVPIIDAIDHTLDKLHLLAANEDIQINRNYNYDLRKVLADSLKRLTRQYSNIVIDVDSSQLDNIEWLSKVCTSIILITTPEVTSIIDTYALIKYLISKIGKNINIKIIVNSTRMDNESKEIYRRLNLMTENFLGVKILYAGSIPFMKSIEQSISEQKPVVLKSSSRGLNKLFGAILKELQEGQNKTHMNNTINRTKPVQMSI